MPRRACRPPAAGRQVALAALALAASTVFPGTALAQDRLDSLAGQPVVEVRVEIAGAPAIDPQIADLVETRTGEPLSLLDVRNTIFHLYHLGRYDDVQVIASEGEAGVSLRYALRPTRLIEAIEIEGDAAFSDDELLEVVRGRTGTLTPVSGVDEIEAALAAFYEERGYFTPQIAADVRDTARPDRVRLILTISSGGRARIGTVAVAGVPAGEQAAWLREAEIAAGEVYDQAALDERIEAVRTRLTAEGHYQAEVSLTATRRQETPFVDLEIAVEPGPIVGVAFEGDPLPDADPEVLVPIATEGSADEDLLEDSARRIVGLLEAEGYRNAQVTYRREADGDRLEIVFTVSRGRPHRVAAVEIGGTAAVEDAEARQLLALTVGEPFVEAALDAGLSALRRRYLELGFRAIAIDSSVAETGEPAPDEAADPTVVWVTPRVVVREGPRALVATVVVDGNEVITDEQALAIVGLEVGAPLYDPAVAAAADALLVAYLNRGYRGAQVEPELRLDETTGAADVRFLVTEGQRLIVDQVIVTGNRRISRETIARELTVQEGEPLRLADLLESQRRLGELGLFRSVRVTDVGQPGSPSRDVVITVEEGAATVFGYGGGVEAGSRLVSQPDGRASEELDFAWRAFVELSRRNLFGKNRTVSLFARVSLRRPNETPDTPDADADTGYGFNEYRVLGTFREPRLFGTISSAQVSGFLEQAIRASFSFNRKGFQADVVRPIGLVTTATVLYRFDKTRTFDEQVSPDEQRLIDRVFPRVTLSTVALALARSTRDDPLNPSEGSFVGFEGTLAARALGSEVGFAKGFLQAFLYRTLPGTERTVLALGARLGLAAGFASEVPDPDDPDTVQVVDDLPASERFFAGGGTTVRGFAQDQLGDDDTLDANGFPTGGNAMLLLNSELRFPVWGNLGAATFVDVGNVFSRVDTFALGDLRGSVGFGVRYQSPLGPIRADVGFKLDRREFGGERERAAAWHISIGQAF